MSDNAEALLNFKRDELYWRTVNNHPFQQSTGKAYHSTDTLLSYFKDDGNFAFQWLFLHHHNASVFDKILKDMPVDLIMRTMMKLARPVYTDFTETTGESTFRDISAEFYRELFWLEKIYVSHDFFKDEGNYIYTGKDRPKEIPHLARKGGFDIWLKLSGNDLDDDIDFMHVKTGITVKVPNGWEKMATAEWCGDRIQNFENWFEYSVQYLAALKKLDKFSRLLVKRVRVEASKRNVSEAMEDIDAALSTVENTLAVDPKHNADVIAVEYANGQDLESLHYTTFNTLDRLIYELGRVSNTNPKGERLTSGENYKDISSIANRQKATLEQLEKFADQTAELFNINLEFAVSGIPEKEMLDTEVKKAPNPNTDDQSGASAGDSVR